MTQASSAPRLLEHDPGWERAFREEAAALSAAFGRDARAIEHVGSTAIPGIRAKPIIDIMVGVLAYEGFGVWRPNLEALGYDYDASAIADEPARLVFRKGPAGRGTLRTHHLHVTQVHGAHWAKILAFRDWLRAHPDVAAAYEALKAELSAMYPDFGKEYTAAKSRFVRAVEASAAASVRGR